MAEAGKLKTSRTHVPQSSPSPGLKTPRVSVPDAMESPRDLESAGKDGPTEWGKGGTHFKPGKNTGGMGTSVKHGCSVDFETGKASY